MTSAERHEARYQRRKECRAEKKSKKFASCDNFEGVFTYNNLYEAYRKCRKGVAWKASVQRFITQAPLNVRNIHKSVHDGSYHSDGFVEFDLMERGKIRHIRSVNIKERIVQRCLCDNALMPVLSNSFIHDNGASRVGKGYSFAIRRLTQHLGEHYRKYGNDGYILLFDFSKFFDRVSHALVKQILRDNFSDPRILKLSYHFVDAFGGNEGLGLGSQISQILALASANRLDHYVKEVLRIRGYGRYMDDGYLIHHDKAYLQKCLEEIKEVCNELGIVINEKKTQIVKLSHGFTWLKVKFFLLPTGRVVKKMNRKSITKSRQKLKALLKKVEDGKMTYRDVYDSWQAWNAYAKQFDSYTTRQNTMKIYNRLFITPIFN